MKIKLTGVTRAEAKILKSVQRRAHYLDKGFSILGLRFGWTFLIGLIPILGDVTDAALNYLLVVRKARQADIPPWLLRRMLLNNAVSTGVGFVPFVGDLVLAMFKANSRNAALLEEFLRIRAEEYLRLQEGEAIVSPEGSGNGKKKDKGVSKKDAEQVKPGAGIVKGEVIPTESSAAATSSSVVVRDENPSPAHSGDTRKRSFNFFGTNGKSKANAVGKASPPGEMGRFVEDVGPTNK